MVLVGSSCLQGQMGVIKMKERVLVKQATAAERERQELSVEQAWERKCI